MKTLVDYTVADRVSDAVIDALNREIKMATNWDPAMLLLGVLLGLKGYLVTAPPDDQPTSLEYLSIAVDNCIGDIKSSKETSR